MKTSFVVGTCLIALGAFILIRGMSYNSQQTVMKVGDFHAAVTTQRAVPVWVGVVTIAGGLLLFGVGFRSART
jgi:hypothetical protein